MSEPNPLEESLVKAAQCADLLCEDIREAMSEASSVDDMAWILLGDLNAQTIRICERLAMMKESFK